MFLLGQSVTALRTDSNFSLFSKQGHLLRRLKVKFQEKKCPGFTAEQQKVSVVEEGGTLGGGGGGGGGGVVKLVVILEKSETRMTASILRPDP